MMYDVMAYGKGDSSTARSLKSSSDLEDMLIWARGYWATIPDGAKQEYYLAVVERPCEANSMRQSVIWTSNESEVEVKPEHILCIKRAAEYYGVEIDPEVIRWIMDSSINGRTIRWKRLPDKTILSMTIVNVDPDIPREFFEDIVERVFKGISGLDCDLSDATKAYIKETTKE